MLALVHPRFGSFPVTIRSCSPHYRAKIWIKYSNSCKYDCDVSKECFKGIASGLLSPKAVRLTIPRLRLKERGMISQARAECGVTWRAAARCHMAAPSSQEHRDRSTISPDED
eukprot:5202958-Pleurochrysis_carterae.AAC.6